jgi:DNA repair ATPase RecN
MNSEEMQQTVEFILQQQAQASAKIDALALAQERNEKKWERTEEGIRALLSIAEIHQTEIASMTEGMQRLSEEMRNLGETTRNTDERLNALINIVERQISEGRNGKS